MMGQQKLAWKLDQAKDGMLVTSCLPEAAGSCSVEQACWKGWNVPGGEMKWPGPQETRLMSALMLLCRRKGSRLRLHVSKL